MFERRGKSPDGKDGVKEVMRDRNERGHANATKSATADEGTHVHQKKREEVSNNQRVFDAHKREVLWLKLSLNGRSESEQNAAKTQAKTIQQPWKRAHFVCFEMILYI